MPVLFSNSPTPPRRVLRQSAACAFAFLAVSSIVHAADAWYAIHGFGTVGAVYHDASGVEYRRDPSRPRGATAGDVTLDTASRLGLQLDVRLASDLEVMVQGTSKLNPDNDWKPSLNWAVLKYAPSTG